MVKRKTNRSSETKIVKIEGDIEKKPVDIPGLIQDFLDAQDIRSISKEVYRKGLEKFFAWKEENQIMNPTRKDLLRFKAYLKESGLTANSCNAYLTHTKRFFAYLHAEHSFDDITKNIGGFTPPEGHLRDPVTSSQIKDILKSIDRETIIGKRNYALILFMARTALRTFSVVEANIEDITQNGKSAHLNYLNKGEDSKGKKVYLYDDSLKALYAYFQARGDTKPTDPIFVSHSDRNNNQKLSTGTIRAVVKKLLRQIGVDSPKLSAHSFRHYRITDSITCGASIQSTQAMAGHKSIETTMRYYHEHDREENAAEKYFTPLV